MSDTSNPAGNPKIVEVQPRPAKREEKTSLAPLDPKDALKAMLSTPPKERRSR